MNFYLVEQADTPLLGRRASESHSFIKLDEAVIELTTKKLPESVHPDSFKSVGDMDQPYDMQLHKDVPGTA